jgi:cell division protein ZapA
MSNEPIPVSVEILDKEYMISCPADEKEALLESARLLNERMRQVRDSGKVFGTDRMAVITALNVIHELTQQDRRRESDAEDANREVQRLAEKIRQAVGRRAAVDQVD